MSRSSVPVSIVVALPVVLCLCTHAASDDPVPTSPNLVKSPSFEEPPGAGGLPDGWTGLNSVPAEGYRCTIAEEGRTGAKALHLEGEGQYGVVWGERLPIDRAQRYRARGYVRIEADDRAAADVKLHYYGAAQDYLGQSRVGYVNPRTPGWQLITVTDEIERFPEAAFVGVALALSGNGRAWFDDIELHAAPEERGPVNYVSNGGMEDVAADRTAGFTPVAAPGGKVECHSSEYQPQQGKRCLVLKADGDWAAGASQQIDIDRSTSFTLTGFVRVSTGEAKISIAYFDAGGTYLGSSDSEVTGAPRWRELTVATEFDRFPQALRFNATAVVHAYAEADFDEFRLLKGGD
jgi:hypothetical protein